MTPPSSSERTKVLLSVDPEDLRIIDEQAAAANMSRSAYLVAMGRQGTASLFQAIETLRRELNEFAHGGQNWKAEVERVEHRLEEVTKERDDARKRFDGAMSLLEPAVDLADSVAQGPENKKKVQKIRDAVRLLRTGTFKK